MNKHLRIFLAGVMVVVPFVATVYLIWWAGSRLDGLVRSALGKDNKWLFPGAGAALVLVGMYLIGLLTHWWLFRWALGLVEKLLTRIPGVKSIYESLRDVLKLFGGESDKMGQVVLYKLPGADAKLLGIRTSTDPRGARGENRVAVYLPMSYQLGGFTLYVPPEAVEPIDMSVEEAMKIAATADVGLADPEQPASSQGEPKAGGEAAQ